MRKIFIYAALAVVAAGALGRPAFAVYEYSGDDITYKHNIERALTRAEYDKDGFYGEDGRGGNELEFEKNLLGRTENRSCLDGAISGETIKVARNENGRYKIVEDGRYTDLGLQLSCLFLEISEVMDWHEGSYNRFYNNGLLFRDGDEIAEMGLRYSGDSASYKRTMASERNIGTVYEFCSDYWRWDDEMLHCISEGGGWGSSHYVDKKFSTELDGDDIYLVVAENKVGIQTAYVNYEFKTYEDYVEPGDEEGERERYQNITNSGVAFTATSGKIGKKYLSQTLKLSRNIELYDEENEPVASEIKAPDTGFENGSVAIFVSGLALAGTATVILLRRR